MIVGAIPSFAPITKEERMVYTTVSSILTIPYDLNAGEDGKGKDGDLPMPTKRLFLEMPYKPRITPMVGIPLIIYLFVRSSPHSLLRWLILTRAFFLWSQLQIATAHGWHPIIGIEAMIEQGLAQQQMWACGDASVDVGSDASILGEQIEMGARNWVGRMNE
jgi:hypothetical protein